MKSTKRKSVFFIALIINILLNLEWSIPAWVLLAFHYWINLPIYWFWIALCAWILVIILWMKLMNFAGKCANEKDPPKENKNPYSVRSKSM